MKVKVNSSFGTDLPLGENVGSRGVLRFDPMPVDK